MHSCLTLKEVKLGFKDVTIILASVVNRALSQKILAR